MQLGCNSKAEHQAISPLLLWGLGVALALASVSTPAQTRDDYCGRSPPPGAEAAPAAMRTGHYVNGTYGYSLTIPAGLSAYSDGREPERGFVIVLAQTPRATLRVDASYDVFYDITAEGVHRRDINTIRLHDTLISDQSTAGVLDHAAGARSVLQLQCQGDAAAAVHEEVIVLRNREIYRVDLQSSPQRYAADLVQFNALLGSWHWQAPPH
jgi:hypothetical protein